MKRVPSDDTTMMFEYSSEHTPCVRVESGERIIVETPWAFGNAILEAGEPLPEFAPSELNPVTGPIWIEGAEPGDTLAIHIEQINTVGAGCQCVMAGYGVLPEQKTTPVTLFTPHDGTIEWFRGIKMQVRPVIGSIGVAPAGAAVAALRAGDFGGNMDTKYVCAGSTIYLPVWNAGALLYLGDCHQIQGDGELSGMAPETAAEVTLACELIKGKAIRGPRILAETRFMTVASASNFEDALQTATRDMVDLLVEEKGFSVEEAYMLTAMRTDGEICRAVSPHMTARVAIDRQFFESI